MSHERDSEPVWKKDPDAAKWTPASVVFIIYVCAPPTLRCQNVLWVREAYEVKEKVNHGSALTVAHFQSICSQSAIHNDQESFY